MDDRILKFADSRQFIGRIARSGENNTRSLAFDCSAALAEYPTSQIIAVIQRPQGDPYTVTPDADGTIRRITLTSYDLEFNGHLQIELRVLDGKKVLKSAIYSARVDDSIRGEADAPGQPVRDVLDRLDAEIKQAQAVVNDIRQKLENGEFNGSDAEVTAANIQSALGFTPVKDVQVAGSSVLVNGVANVPIANKVTNGVVRPDFYGIGVNSGGILYVQNTSNTNITNRVERAPLTAYNLDYAVKAAMCDGKGAAWTSAEQKAARDRIGVDSEFELIEETVLTEETLRFERAQEPDGTPYNFSAIRIIVKFIPGQMTGYFYCHGKNGDTWIVGGTSNVISMPGSSSDAYWRSTAIFSARPGYGGVYDCDVASGNQGGEMSITRASNGEYAMSKIEKKIQFIYFYLYAGTNVPMIAGTEISIYGVRA